MITYKITLSLKDYDPFELVAQDYVFEEGCIHVRLAKEHCKVFPLSEMLEIDIKAQEQE